MDARVLLIIPSKGLAEHLRQELVGAGGWIVDLAPAGIPALAAAQARRFDLAILDSDVADVPPAELAQALLDWHPQMRLVLVHAAGRQALGRLEPHAFLEKPFSALELHEVVSDVMRGSAAGGPRLRPGPFAAGDDAAEYPWLEDVNRAAQYLARLTLETAARAALIARGEQLWAYAGDLGQPAGDELAAAVGRSWDSQDGKDLARFVTLDNEQEYMLYATGLPDGLVLALIFDAKTPFSKIRSQSSRLARALASGPELSPAAPAPLSPIANRNGRLPAGEPVQPRADQQTQSGEAVPAADLEAVDSARMPADWPPPVAAHARLAAAPAEQANPGSVFDEHPLYPPPESLAETRPNRSLLSEDMSSLETEAASYFRISYAAVMLPRFPHHHLAGDLARLLEEWMQQVCVSFDWRLEQLAIRPEHMHFIVRVHAAIAPGFMMKIVARLTSQKILEHYPLLLRENPSGEFWAPGWLVMTGDKAPSPPLVQEFIANTRRRQGLR